MKGNTNIWWRLVRNRGTLFGLVVIGAAVVIALTGYLIAPDGSPDANRIIVEIGGRKPGFRPIFLLLPRQAPAAPVSFFHRLLYGRDDRFDYIPITAYARTGD